MPKARILIIDGSVIDRRVMSRCLSEDSAIEVVGYAAIASAAIVKTRQLKPDLVILDTDMPDVHGLELLQQLLKEVPGLKVIVVSAHTERGAELTFDALARGAKDYCSKPYDMTDEDAVSAQFKLELIPKIKALCGLLPRVEATAEKSTPRVFQQRLLCSPRVDVVVIGASTGGPDALKTLITQLPRNFPVPILVVQHMPSLFTKRLALSLSAESGFVAREAMPGVIPVPGEIWVAPGDFHLIVDRVDGVIRLDVHQGPHENFCRPSADVLFRAVANVYGAHTMACVLTGMGKDGVAGCHLVKQRGGQVLAQDKASSVVWGMPGLVADAGLADRVLSLRQMAEELVLKVRNHRAWQPDSVPRVEQAP